MFGHLPVAFDSASLAEGDRFGFAREEYGLKVLNVDLSVPAGTPFHLRMGGASYGDVRVAVIRGTPYRVARTRSLAADGDDRLGLVFPLEGRFGGEQHGRAVAARRGEAAVTQGDRAGHFGTDTGGAFLTIRVPPPLVRAHENGRGAIAPGATARPSRLALDLIRGYLAAFNRSEEEPSPEMRALAGRHLAELAVHAFLGGRPDARRAPEEGEGIRAARLAAARADMEAHFADPGYGVAACAGHLGISVRYLQAILGREGLSFGDELRRLRLRRALALLSDPLRPDLRVIDVALDCGFSDVSYFNRQFRAAFGDSPTGYRSQRD